MKLAFVYLPVKDLESALALYRDQLGFRESWREGTTTAGLTLPGTEIQMMLEHDADAPHEADKPGPIFQVDSVDEFYAQNKGQFVFTVEPHDIPPGRYAAFEDPSGNRIRVLDDTRERQPA